MNVLLIMIRRSPALFAIGTLVGAIGGGATTLLIGLLARLAFDQTSAPGSRLAMAAGLAAVIVVCSIASQQILARLGQDAAVEMRVDLSRMILKMPLRDTEVIGKHTVLSVLTQDVATITGTLPATPVIAVNLATVAACLVYLVSLSARGVGFVAAFMACGFVAFGMLQGRSVGWYKKLIAHQTTLFKHLRAIAEGTKELKLSRERRDGFLERSVIPEAVAIRTNWLHTNMYFVLAAVFGTLLHLTVTMLVLVLGRTMLHMTPSQVGAFSIVLLYMIAPLQTVMGLLPALNVAAAAWKRIQDLESNVKAAAVDAPGQSKIGASAAPSIKLAGVSHSYASDRDDSKFTLGPADMEIRAGEIVFIVGGNGSGKSTLGKLITGLYVPEEGRLECDGKVVNDSNREDFRQMFASVFSDFYLFDDLARIPSAEQTARGTELLRDLHLDKKVTITNGVFSTTDLSTGQRKRLALLAACLEDKPVMFFDEWAADQDPTFKDVFYRRILPDLKSRGKTLVVITHDDRYFDLADQLVRMENGQIVATERGQSAAA